MARKPVPARVLPEGTTLCGWCEEFEERAKRAEGRAEDAELELRKARMVLARLERFYRSVGEARERAFREEMDAIRDGLEPRRAG